MLRGAIKEGSENTLAKVLIASVSDDEPAILGAEPTETKADIKGHEEKEVEVIASLILAHRLGGQATWVDLCRHAGVDPADVVGKRGSEAVKLVCAAQEEVNHASFFYSLPLLNSHGRLVYLPLLRWPSLTHMSQCHYFWHRRK